MLQSRKLLSPLHLLTRCFGSMTSSFKSKEGEALTDNWLERLQSVSPTPSSSDLQSQLSSILHLYNSPPPSTGSEHHHTLPPIDFSAYKTKINTEGVVDRIQQMYDQFMQEEYDISQIIQELHASQEQTQEGELEDSQNQEELSKLDALCKYNYAIWYTMYLEHVKQKESVNAVGDLNMLSAYEFNSYFPGLESLYLSELEIGNLSPESYIEEGLATNICMQFTWGNNARPPFVHSSEVVSTVGATTSRFGK